MALVYLQIYTIIIIAILERFIILKRNPKPLRAIFLSPGIPTSFKQSLNYLPFLQISLFYRFSYKGNHILCGLLLLGFFHLA